MDSLLAVKLDEDGLPLELEDCRPALQARSLANALMVCKRKLIRLNEVGAHTKEDMEHYKNALDLMQSDLNGLPAPHSLPAGKAVVGDARAYRLCTQRLDECLGLLQQMEATAVTLPEALSPNYPRLLGLRRRLARMHKERVHGLQEVEPLQAELDTIHAIVEKMSREGVNSGSLEADKGGAEGTTAGQHACEELLSHCQDLLAECLHEAVDLPDPMQKALRQLRHIKNALHKLCRQQGSTVEELQHFQARLEQLEAQGALPCGEGGAEAEGAVPRSHQAAQELLKDCYDLIEGHLESAGGMSSEAKAVYGRLEQCRHTLEAMGHHPHSFQELLEIQVSLHKVDDDRQAHAGVFAGQTGEGRACSGLLNHCYRLLHELYGTATTGGKLRNSSLE